MKILVVGATGALGREVLAEALRCGHDNAALVRDRRRAALEDSIETIEGDVLRAASLARAVSDRDAVICALGTPSPRQPSTLLRAGTKNLVAAMREQRVGRLVCVTLLGVGGSRTHASFVYRELILRALAPMVPDKEAQEQVVRESGLEWTLVRPPRITGTGARDRVRVLHEGDPGRVGHVARADLASFLVECTTHGRHTAEAVTVGSLPTRRR